MAEPTGASPTLPQWAEALAEVLFPPGVNAQRAVLVAADDAAVQQAASRLGLEADTAVPTLCACVRRALGVSAQQGLGRMAELAADARRRPRPSTSPPAHLAVICVLVLAASHMEADQTAPANAYYRRLSKLVGTAPSGQPPGFDVLETMLRQLEEWLRVDMRGERGLLARPTRVKLTHINRPIAQTLLRRADQEVLEEFFGQRRAALSVPGADVVFFLRTWGGRHQLSLPGRQVLDDDGLSDPLAGLIRRQFAAWQQRGPSLAASRPWPLIIRLFHASGQASLGLAHAHAAGPRLHLRRPDGSILVLPGGEGEVHLDAALLAQTEAGPLTLSSSLGGDRIVLPATPLLFAATEVGLVRVGAALEGDIWVLGPPAAWPTAVRAHALPAAGLPPGWELAGPCGVDELPSAWRTHLAPAQAAVSLVGGLPLGLGTYLLGGPPRLAAAADLDEARPVLLDGQAAGTIEPGAELGLGLAAATAGAHEIRVVGAGLLRYQMLAQGLRVGWGQIGWRRGAAAAQRLDVGEDDALVGARIPGAAPLGPAPLVVASGPAQGELVGATGDLVPVSVPPIPAWMYDPSEAGGGPRVRWWAPPGAEGAEWLLLFAAAPQVLRLGRGEVALHPRLAELVRRLADVRAEPAPGLDVDRDVVQAEWAALVYAARAEDASVAG